MEFSLNHRVIVKFSGNRLFAALQANGGITQNAGFYKDWRNGP